MGAALRRALVLAMAGVLLGGCQTSGVSPAQSWLKEDFLGSFDVATARTSAKPIVRPIELRLRPTHGPATFNKVDRALVDGRALPEDLSKLTLTIEPRGAEAFGVSFDFGGMREGMYMSMKARAAYNARGMKMNEAEISSSVFTQMKPEERTAVRKILDGILALMFCAAGHDVGKVGDEIYSIEAEGIVPGATGRMTSIAKGETFWGGREVLIGDLSGTLYVTAGDGTRIPASLTGTDVFDKKSALLLANSTHMRLIAGDGRKAEMRSQYRIDPDSLAKLP